MRNSDGLTRRRRRTFTASSTSFPPEPHIITACPPKNPPPSLFFLSRLFSSFISFLPLCTTSLSSSLVILSNSYRSRSVIGACFSGEGAETNKHEIVGIVTEVEPKVSNFKVGVGYMVGSCLTCDSCNQNLENFCPSIITTSNGVYYDGSTTYGGFSDVITVKERFVVHVPENLPLDKTAPLLCAGVSTYTPMKRFGLDGPGKHLGVVGLGGLGHVAVKFGKAFGMKVTVISMSISKKKEAIENLGADAFLVSKDPEQLKASIGTMDGIIDTVSAFHPVVPLIALLKVQGKMIIVGGPAKPLEVPAFSLIEGGKLLAGNAAGGTKETQEMLDFAGKHNITAEIELVGMDYINTAIERLEKGDVRYRFVIDMASLKEA